MAEYYEVLEIAGAGGQPSGRYRYTRRTDDPVSGPFGLCEHEHATRDEAASCPIAKTIVDRAFGRDTDSLRRRVEQAKRDLADAEKALADADGGAA